MSDAMVKKAQHTQTKQRVKVNDRYERFLEYRLTAAETAYEWFVKSRWMSPYQSGLEEQAQYPERWREYCDEDRLWGITKQGVYFAIDECIDNDDPVLILGATGTGKELVCNAIHRHSKSRKGPLKKANLAGLPTELLSSELFGHVKGAFTGANKDRQGAIELADGGTLFLDEIGDLTPEAQKKLLRFLQDGSYERVGEAGKQMKVDVRIIAATNREIDKAECRQELKFRDDLYYRLCGIPIRMAPLRKTFAEIAYLTARFLVESNQEGRERISCLPFDFVVNMLLYGWLGNVRQLEHTLRFVFRRVRKKLIEYKKVKKFIKQEKLPSTGYEYLRSCMTEFSSAFFDYIGGEETAGLVEDVDGTIVPELPFGYKCYVGVPLSLDIVCARIQAVPFISASTGHLQSPSLVYLRLLADHIGKNKTFRNLAPQYSKVHKSDDSRRQPRPLSAKVSDYTQDKFRVALENFKTEYFGRLFEANPTATNTSIVQQTGADPATVAKYRNAWQEKTTGK